MTAHTLLMAAGGSTPGAFSIPAVSNATVSTQYTSSQVTPTGYSSAATISVSGGGGTISVQGGTYGTSDTISPGQYFTARMTSSGSFSTGKTATVNVGGTTGNFTVTTEAVDTVPSSFSITAVTGAALSTVTTSSAVTPTGYNSATTISVSGTGTISVAGGGYTTSTTISPGQSFTVRMTSSSSNSTAVSCTVNAGGTTATWTVTTVAGIDFALPDATASFDGANTVTGPSVQTPLQNVTGMTGSASISITSTAANFWLDTYTANAGSIVGTAITSGTLPQGGTFRATILSSNTPGATVSATVTVGSVSKTTIITSP